MIKGFFSRYSPYYPKKLVYMLQTTEYYVGDYLDWFLKTTNFGTVEKTGKLVYTKKAIILLVIAWLTVIKLVLFSYLFALSFAGNARYFIFLVCLLLVPYILGFLMIVPVIFIKYFVQKPIEFFIAGKLKKKLADFPGTKIAIAGSYGKTSMREITKTILSQGKIVAAPGGSINTLLGINSFVKTLSGKEEVLIFELGEYYPGDVARLTKIVQPNIGVITGINEAHLKRFKSIDRTIATIFELADEAKDATIYVNAENKLAKENIRKGQISYSRDGVDGWKSSDIKTTLEGTKFTLKNGKNSLDLETKLLGTHQVGPIAAGVDIAKKIGMTDTEIARGVKNTKPFKRRLEYRLEPSGVVILDDSYNGNPDGVEAVIDFLATLSDYRRFYVTSGLVEMGDKSQEVHKKIGQQLAKAGIEKVILVKTSVTPFIEIGLKDAGFKGEILWYDDTALAYSAIPQLTVKGDLVLLQNDWPDQYR